MEASAWHFPVMAAEVLEYLAVRPDGVYIDATAGLGGHTAAIAGRLAAGLVFSCDRDPESLALARANTQAWAERIRWVETKFSDLQRSLASAGLERADGLVADLGVSRYQLTEPLRGFSLAASGPLDMRMSRSQRTTAADLVNFTAERELADLIWRLGQERRARRIARAIVRGRPVTTTGQLVRIIESAVPRTGRLSPATLTFMALRMAVNEEQEELDALLAGLPALVKAGGRAVVISFMSLEDGKVKNAFRDLARSGRARILTKHVVKPSAEEVRRNPPSRSARLRAIEFLEQSGPAGAGPE